MDKDTQQLNNRQLHDYEASINAYKNLYKDLYKEFMHDKMTFDDDTLAEYVYSSVFHYYKKEMPSDLENYDLSMAGIIVKDVKIDEKIIKTGMTPLFCTYKDTNECVMLVPNKFLGYCYILANGKRKKVNKKFILTKLNNDAKAFYAGFRPVKLSLNDLIKYMLSILFPSDLLAYFMCIALVTAMGLFVPFINKGLFSLIETDTNYEFFIGLIIMLLTVSTVRILLESMKRILQRRVMLRQSAFVNIATMYRILTLPVSFFKKNLPGELAYRLQYINNVCNTMLGALLDTLIVAIFSISYIFQIQYFDAKLVWPSIIIVALSCIANICCSIVRAKYMNRVMNANSVESGLSYDIITGMEKIRLTGSEVRTFALWANNYRKLVKIQYLPPKLIKHSESILKTIELCGMIIISVICIMSAVSKPDYIAFLSSFSMLSISFLNLSNISKIFAEIKTSISFIKPILEETPEEKEDKKIVTSLNGKITFSNVSFAYDMSDKFVFENLSFDIKEGEYVSIVGASGSGKSTIIRLILGLEKVKNGAIYVDDVDIREYEPTSYRKNVGSVLQNEKLYSMNIKSNIKMANSTATDEDVYEALKKAELYDDLKTFPMGVNTLISDNYGVSSGQKQRILLARCFITNSNIMIFDEATNALDIHTEKKVFENIKNLKCTRIVVAHTFSSMKDSDKIIVLDGGKVAEIGTYDELIKNKGIFCRLINSKVIDE